jgi:hypothetical protein
LDAAAAPVRLAARERAYRLNQGARRFPKAADNRVRAAQVTRSDELLRPVVEAEGQAVRKAPRQGALTLPGSGSDCRLRDAQGQPTPATRVSLGAEGVKGPLVPDPEKQARRDPVKQQRRRRGKKRRPLPRARRGADQRSKEFKGVPSYDQEQEHRHVAVPRGDHEGAGQLRRRDAGRIGRAAVDDKGARGDGAPWIKNPLQGQRLPPDDGRLDFSPLADNVP